MGQESRITDTHGLQMITVFLLKLTPLQSYFLSLSIHYVRKCQSSYRPYILLKISIFFLKTSLRPHSFTNSSLSIPSFLFSAEDAFLPELIGRGCVYFEKGYSWMQWQLNNPSCGICKKTLKKRSWTENKASYISLGYQGYKVQVPDQSTLSIYKVSITTICGIMHSCTWVNFDILN